MEITMGWAYLKANLNTIFRIHIVNSNNIVEYYLPYDVEKRHSVRIEQICFIDNQDVLTSPKFNLTLSLLFIHNLLFFNSFLGL